MEEKKDTNNLGCLKIILILAAVSFAFTFVSGALEGIGNAFSEIPWYGLVILNIGFWYIIYKVFS